MTKRVDEVAKMAAADLPPVSNPIKVGASETRQDLRRRAGRRSSRLGALSIIRFPTRAKCGVIEMGLRSSPRLCGARRRSEAAPNRLGSGSHPKVEP